MVENIMNYNSILDGLNVAQKEAVTYGEGPLLVLAGAGSGKTRVLTSRIAHLISTGVPSYNFLAVTFTNKAAQEMKTRISNMVSEDVWVSTFHSSCLKILKIESKFTKLNDNFSVYDDSDQLLLIKECLKELRFSDKDYVPKVIKEKINRAKDAFKTPGDLKSEAATFYAEGIAKIYSLYEKKLVQYSGIDFGGLIFSCINLFEEHPAVLEKYQRRFKYILVDEYQDTNRSQYYWIQLLAKGSGNLTVVGDPDQSIYGWRGADVGNILSFESDYPETHIICLEKNYRSTQTILDASNEIIKNNFDRKEKMLWTDSEQGELIGINQNLDEKAEAHFVAEAINEMEVDGISLDDIVIFYRTHAQSRVLEEFLRKFNLPYKIVGGLRFYDRKEIKDLMAYLKVVVTPQDEISLKRIINVPTRGIGKKAIEKIEDYKNTHNLSFYEALNNVRDINGISTRAKDSINKFFETIDYYHNHHNRFLASDILTDLIDSTKYTAGFEKDDSLESRTRIENIKEFMGVIKEFEASSSYDAEKSVLAQFLDMISLQTSVDTFDENNGTLSLMTIHSAKGLEFDNVFLVGMEERIFPHVNVINGAERDIEEERRLCYVAITRARKKVNISYAVMRTLYGNTMYNPPSRFIDEIPDEFCHFSGQSKQKPKRNIDSFFLDDEIELDYTW